MTTGNALADMLIVGFLVLSIAIGIVWEIKSKTCPVCARFIKKQALTCYHCGAHLKNEIGSC